jgi:DNA-directed RNA polymerase specialized sigma24 family protein
MSEQAYSAMQRNGYATCQDFLRVFDEDMRGLYRLSFLLAGDPEKAERCFVAGMEDCAEENQVFREWARIWAKRVIVQNAIRELQPRPSHSDSFALAATAFSQKNGPIEGFDLDAVLGLANFERFVFVLCVLERYREYECALLLGCSASEVREARTQAIQELAKFRSSVFDVYGDRSAARGQKRSRPKGSRHEGTCIRSIVRPPVQA